MSYSGDAAEQVVRMSPEGTEVAVKLAGEGAKQLAVLLYALLREQKKTKGKLDNKIPMYVTWACKGGNNYYWGHYFSDPLEAKKDLLGRAGEELEYQMERRARAAEKPPKEQEKERER